MSTFGGKSKYVVNAWISRVLTRLLGLGPRHKVLILDTSALGTSRQLAPIIGKQKIIVFGIDRKLPQESKKFGIEYGGAWSHDVLDKYSKSTVFGFIFLDFCGTPSGNARFNPSDDIAKASTMIKPGGAILCTFSKRTRNITQKCMNMTPPTLSMQQVFEYCDSSAMMLVVYSSRKLPLIGPPVDTIVSVKNPSRGVWHGRVDSILPGNRCKLTWVKKTNNKWSRVVTDEPEWHEPFNRIHIVQLPKIKKMRFARSAAIGAAPMRGVVPGITMTQEQLLNNIYTQNQILMNMLNSQQASIHHVAPTKTVSEVKAKKDMEQVRQQFRAWFDECVDSEYDPLKLCIAKSTAWQHYKLWCDTKNLPKAHRLSDRCNGECKALKCPLDTCPRFLVHMCDALGHEYYVKNKKTKLCVRETRKTSQSEGGNYYYKAHFNSRKACKVRSRGMLITNACYKK